MKLLQIENFTTHKKLTSPERMKFQKWLGGMAEIDEESLRRYIYLQMADKRRLQEELKAASRYAMKNDDTEAANHFMEASKSQTVTIKWKHYCAP